MPTLKDLILIDAPQQDSRDSAVMAGLVPAIQVASSPEALGIWRKRRRVDGGDKPGHDGNGGFSYP
jgi:hypothetical protein